MKLDFCPVLRDNYLKNHYPYEKKEIEGGKYGINFSERYSKDKWETTLLELQKIYNNLPNSEKENALIWGKHYSQAGAVNLFNEKFNLPKAFSLHGSFYSWIPTGEMPAVTIGLSYNVGDFFQEHFDEVIKVKTIYNPYSENLEELHQHVYLCKQPKQTFEELKESFKDRIFE